MKAQAEAKAAGGELSEHRMLSDETTGSITIRVGVRSDIDMSMDTTEQTEIAIEENDVGTTEQNDSTIKESREADVGTTRA